MRNRRARAGVSIFLIFAMLFASMLNFDTASTAAAAAKKASLKKKKLTLYKGQKKKIAIKNENKKAKYLFSSSDKKTASVAKDGTVKAKKYGKATITVREKYKGKKRKLGKVKVTVKKKKSTQKPKKSSTPTSSQKAPVTTAPVTTDPAASATAEASPTPGKPSKSPKPTLPPLSFTPIPSPTKEPLPTPRIEASLYVSENGDDAADGSKEHPVRSLQRAKELVKTLDRSGGDIAVEFEDGFYPVEDTVRFTSGDSGTKNGKIIYRAAEGANPIISGGKKLEAEWVEATEVKWLKNGLKAYKAPLERAEKLRAIYVNGKRASMTIRSKQPVGSGGSYSVKRGQADWAWTSRSNMITEVEFDKAFNLSPNTRNPQNIELESGSRWAKQLVCAESLSKTSEGNTKVKLQMPYGALAQNLGWGTAYSPETENDVANVFEWLDSAGQFYFDQAGSMLYYIPFKGEDINSADVVIPEIDTIIEISGDTPKSSYVENIVFDGLSFAYSDWNLYELENSHGYASVQGAIMLTKFGKENQHDDIYRSYDVPPAAVHLNSARNVSFLNGEIRHTGYLGIHLENDVNDCEVTGNNISNTGGAGVVVGHPQHVYENDTADHHVKSSNSAEPNAGPDKEKFKNGTESVPKNIKITNNYLLEDCYFFPGNSPITTFYTYNLQVLHNFVYKCSYSGMSIGWGWCNFDGETGSDSQLPGFPTNTSKNNHVNFNRVEEICSLLQDAGGIYTLGKQGNDDWTEYSEMSFNYINCMRAPQKADGSRMVNGFHPDEGSAYIWFDSNVVTNIIRNVYELNNWRRKHDMLVTNGFSNTNRSETTAPKCKLEQYVNEKYIWPLKGYQTVLYSGLEDKYVHMVGKDVIPDTDYELAANVNLMAGQKLPRRGLLKKEDEVWLAKEGTTTFAVGDEMTKAAGNEKDMDIPAKPGEYKLYIKYADGTLSEASTFTLYVGALTDVANVTDGQEINVSKLRPLTLVLQDGKYSYTLNGKKVTSGEKISTAGTWTLKTDTETIVFKTYVMDANKLLNDDITVKSEGEVKFSEPLGDAAKVIWLAPSGLSAFDENDPTMSKAKGDSTSMKAPKEPGKYILTVVDSKGEILSQSDAFVTVE